MGHQAMGVSAGIGTLPLSVLQCIHHRTVHRKESVVWLFSLVSLGSSEMEDLLYHVLVARAMRIQLREEESLSQAPRPQGHALSPPNSLDSFRMTGWAR